MKSLRLTLAAAVVMFLSCFLRAEEPAPANKPPPKAPDPSFAVVPDVPGLPRVLLIGDSISMGYTLPVRAKLAGKANVHRPGENCGDTARGLRRLDAWLGEGHWDVIHFNFGLHDLKYLDEKGAYVPPEKGRQVASLEQYEKNLRALVARLRQTEASLIFATTTPVPAGTLGRVAHDELRYNAVAVRVMKELGVPLDDLHAGVVPQQEKIQRPKNVHFTAEGYERMAEEVAACIATRLPSPEKK
jgi:lysophospholipase L1-like esterase